MGPRVDDHDRALLRIGHVDGVRERRVGDRDRQPPHGDLIDRSQRPGVDHGDRTIGGIGEECTATIGSERDLVQPAADSHRPGDPGAFDVDGRQRRPRGPRGIMGDPQVMSIGLERNARWQRGRLRGFP